MPRRRKKSLPDKEKLLEVLFRGWLNQWVEADGLYGIINLDSVGKEGVGLVLMDAFQCIKCENVFLREGQESNLCNECKNQVSSPSSQTRG